MTVRGPEVSAVVAAVRSLRGIRLLVGIQGAEAGQHYAPKEGQKASPLTLVEVASVHEFGSQDGSIPERSFLRSTADRKGETYIKAAAQAIGQALDQISIRGIGPVADTFAAALDPIGLRVVRDVQTTIRDQGPGWKPLAAVTIKRKGSSKALIDTGRLRQSIRHTVRRSA